MEGPGNPVPRDRVPHLGKRGVPRGRQVLSVSCVSEGRAGRMRIPPPLWVTQSSAHKGRGTPARAPGVPKAQGLPLRGPGRLSHHHGNRSLWIGKGGFGGSLRERPGARRWPRKHFRLLWLLPKSVERVAAGSQVAGHPRAAVAILHAGPRAWSRL